MVAKTLMAGVVLGSAMLLSGADARVADAAMQGDRTAVRDLIAHKADVNAKQGDGSTALHWAASRDDVDMAKMLIAAGADVKAQTREGVITPLFLACTNGSGPMVDLLLKAGADPNSVKSNGTTALMIASASGGAEAVRILVEHGAQVNAKESIHGQTALHFAAGFDRAAVAKVLLAHGADANALTEVKKVETLRFDQDGNIVEDKGGAKKAPANESDEAAFARTNAEAMQAANDALRAELDALAHALQFKSTEYLLAKPRGKAGDVAFKPPQKVGPEYFGGMTALLYAAREGYLDTARAIVEGGADINLASGDKYTPMVLAIANGHLDVAKYFLDKGADPNLAGLNGLTPLYATIDLQWSPKAFVPQPSLDQEKVKYLDFMKDLIEHGANVNARISEKSWFRGYADFKSWVDDAGATAFWRAANAVDLPAMHMLIEHGADPKIPNKAGDTPLMAAAGIGWGANWNVDAPFDRMDVVKYCVQLGNDVKAVDSKGYTALHGAAYLGNNELVKYLISLGADIKAKTKAGDTVADMANGPTRFGMPHLDTVALVEKLGSANSHNCRSDQCVVAANAAVYTIEKVASPAEIADREALDTFAVSLGMKSAEYLADAPAAQGGRRGRGDGPPAAGGPSPESTKPPAR
jgi:ankyrin repeat protein